ncbi:hypothetical protein EDB86DRAFT_2833847 [Lactarius hatsudake]|nr:hypothetical protein EDB86DRAFT_2833847 [Lactarius hatsudake]
MSSSSLKFNPFGNNPFTDHVKGAIPEPPPPSKYARGVPSAYLQNPPSPPSTQPTTPPLVAPIPQYAPPQMVTARSTSSASSTSSSSSSVSTSKQIFTLYRPDGRATPELEDVLSKKKSTWSKKNTGSTTRQLEGTVRRLANPEWDIIYFAPLEEGHRSALNVLTGLDPTILTILTPRPDPFIRAVPSSTQILTGWGRWDQTTPRYAPRPSRPSGSSDFPRRRSAVTSLTRVKLRSRFEKTGVWELASCDGKPPTPMIEEEISALLGKTSNPAPGLSGVGYQLINWAQKTIKHLLTELLDACVRLLYYQPLEARGQYSHS